MKILLSERKNILNTTSLINQCFLRAGPHYSGLFLVFSLYFLIYGYFLLKTNFLPYVFDNNETFSCLTHAKSLYDFGWGFTYGLTDESFGISPESHPYVYTHQGNFPRIYAYFLYCLGFRSAEWQILVTTFTVGLAGIWFCYHYFSKYVSSLFSVIFCLLLMTDYVMFMQWQVNTWRVWHLFFFFSSFLCCHGLSGNKRKFFIVLSMLNFACLFYMEIAYALFVTSSCAIYLLLQKEVLWKRKFYDCTILAFGSALGVGILIGQNIAYLGWDIFFQDLSYTFISRNHSSLDKETFVKEVVAFYEKNKIAFWNNFHSPEGRRNPITILKNFYQYNLLSYSPFFTLVACIVMVRMGIFCVQDRFLGWRMPSYLSVFSNKTLKYLMLCSFSLSLFFLIIFSSPLSWNKEQVILEFFKPVSLGSFFIANYIFFKSINQNTIDLKEKDLRVNNLNFVFNLVFFFLVICISYFVFKQSRGLTPALFVQNRVLWSFGGEAATTSILSLLFLINTLCIGHKESDSSREVEIFKKIIPFLVATSLGFLFIYLILPGYVITGYFWRYCCFTVFFHIILYTWFFYVITAQILRVIKSYKIKLFMFDAKNLQSSGSGVEPSWQFMANLFLLTAFASLWLSLQCCYVKEFPPKGFDFVKLFKREPFHKHSVVANSYAAPFFFVSQSWSYFDPMFGYSTLNSEKKNEIQYKRDLTYLWLGDALTNQQYKKPDLFVCWVPRAFDQIGQRKPRCEDLSLVTLARSKEGAKLGLKELRMDTSGRDRWSIIQLKNFS